MSEDTIISGSVFKLERCNLCSICRSHLSMSVGDFDRHNWDEEVLLVSTG